MAFPATDGTSAPLSPDAAWQRAREAARGIKSQCTMLLTSISAGPTSSRTVLESVSSLVAINALLTTYKAVPGIQAYAQGQVTGLDIATEFTNMQAALIGVLNWVANNFPKDGSGNLLYLKFDGTAFTYVSFTSASLAGFATQLNALSATIA